MVDRKIRKELIGRGHFAKNKSDDIVGDSRLISQTKQKAMRYAMSNSAVLIVGETGVGKEMFAQSIHNYSNRKYKPFVAVNCAALPQSIMESELFGYVKGASTFSPTTRAGRTQSKR
ncbi:MAG: sigma 54-interacting transcriptional regulator [Oscillospiraceae bacterium]|nr:sigma 54-interacting transcriptional regulator [Oscillospiraceae bacterium]